MSVCEDKASEQTKRHDGLNDDLKILDLQEDRGRPRPDAFCVQFSSKANFNSVSKVEEQLSSLPKCLDISFIGKHDDDAGVDAIPYNMRNTEIHERNNQIKRNFRKRRKFSDNPERDTEPKEDATCSSSRIMQKMTETTSGHSNEVTSSCCPKNILEREVTVGHGSSSNVGGDVLIGDAWDGCSEFEQSSAKNMNNIEMENSKENTSESSFSEDVTTVNLQINNSEQVKCDSSNPCTNVVNDVYPAEENLNESMRVDEEGKTADVSSCGSSNEYLELKRESLREDLIPSSSPAGAMGGNVTDVASEGSITSQVLRFSLGRVPIGRFRKKLLVLDVNGLLADIVSYVPDWYKPDAFISRKGVFKRPFCEDFLQFCFQRFDVGVWSSRYKRNVDLIVDFIMGKAKEKLLFCWDQSHCTDTGFNTVENRDKPLVLKELKKLWEKHDPSLPWDRGEYNESNTLLLDDSPHKALRNPPHTAVFPHPYRYKDEKDNSLGPGGGIRSYLEGLALAEDVQKYVQQNPFGQRPITERNLSWRFYLKVISATSSHAQGHTGTSSAYQWQ